MPDDLPNELIRLQALQEKIRAGRVLEGVRRVIALLNQARREIVADVMETDWQRFYLPRLNVSVTRHLEHWRDLAINDLSGDMAMQWDLGVRDVDAVMRGMDIAASLPDLPTSLLQTLQHKMARKVTHVTNFAKDQIDRTIALSLLTGESREDAVTKIGRSLIYGSTDGRPQGRFRTIANRARFIYEHEVGTTYAVAKHQRFQQSAALAPGLKKVWLHQGHPRVPRFDHILMHGQVRAHDHDFTNYRTGAELAFPLDPEADISETGNCTCTMLGWREEFGPLEDYIGQPQKKAVPAGTPQTSPHLTREQDAYNPLNYVVPGQPVIKGGRP